jgi:hypothetical protein
MSLHHIVGATCGAALRPGFEYRPALDENVRLGFNLVRVFGGRLTWCGQEIGHVYDRLPTFRDEAHQRGLNVEVSGLTDSREGDREAYDRRGHNDRLCGMVDAFDLFERANEPYHETQYELTPEFLGGLPMPGGGVIVADGASPDDEDVTDYIGGMYVTRHLDRGRDKWNMVRRVRELMAVSEGTGKPVLNNEPIGAAEQAEPGRRESDPAIFLTMGALDRLFTLGGIFHSDDGLTGQVLAPQQRQCAEAFVRGSRCWPHAEMDLVYKNVGHGGSPIVSATFNDGDLNRPGCTRSYSGILGGTGFNVTLGISDMNNPGAEIGNGWRWGAEIDRMPGVLIREVLATTQMAPMVYDRSTIIAERKAEPPDRR